MHAKGRHIDLRNSGRKLNAPPEGYGPKREAQVKQWLARLPEDVAEADEVHSIPVRQQQTETCNSLHIHGKKWSPIGCTLVDLTSHAILQ
jgi:hypothetical protein